MSDEGALERTGIFFDELNRIRIVHQTNSAECEQLQLQCTSFTHSIDQLQQVIERLCSLATSLGQQVDAQKLRAIGLRNAVQASGAASEAHKQLLMAACQEKQQQLLRYQKELAALKLESGEQEERLNNFLLN